MSGESFRRGITIAVVAVSVTLVANGVLGDDETKPEPSPIASKPGPASRLDKSGFTLFNPTPADLMRGFNPDRPDVTESPYTVDAGHLQVERSFIEYTYDHDHGVRTDGFSVLPTNLRLGVLNNLELALAVNPYQNVHVSGGGGAGQKSSTSTGFGDTQITGKLNLWGNDGDGKTAGGLMPFVRFPTGAAGLSNHHVEGGLLLPFAVRELPGGFDLGTMAEFNLRRNQSNSGYGVDVIHTVTIGREIVEHLGAYVEYVGVAPVNTGHSYLAYFDTGLTYALGKNVELDVGINVGASRHAADYTLFSGLSFRL